MIRLLWMALIVAQAQGEAPLSPFQTTKAEALLRNRLPCLGCHELNGEGGHIGPSLSELQHFRTPEYVYSMIRDPQGTAPGSIMPRVPMAQATLDLIARYLVELAGRRFPQSARAQSARQRPQQPQESVPAAPSTAHPAEPPSDSGHPLGAAALYARFCAPCHGDRGHADGYNVQYLPVRPTAHADSAYMSRRSDDALFDATYAGGFIMNRSNRMPPFGQTLTRDQIWDLVRYLRTLCRCEGPAWSRDNQ